MRTSCVLVSIGVLLWAAGCDGVKLKGRRSAPQDAVPQAEQIVVVPPAAQQPSRPLREPLPDPVEDDALPGTGFDFSFSESETTAHVYSGPRHPGLEQEAVSEMLIRLVTDSVQYGPTLVVWLIDQSVSARTMVKDLGGLLRTPYRRIAENEADGDAPLLTAVVAFGKEVRFLHERPDPDPSSLGEALDRLPDDNSGRESTFAAVAESLERYLPYRTQQRRELLLIVLTDEAGDDAERFDTLAAQPKRFGIPVYVVGVPAPFGRRAALPDHVESNAEFRDGDEWRPIRQGPESFALESLQLEFWGPQLDLELIDSGFGPFALERLCRSSGGRYFALRPRGGQLELGAIGRWPNREFLSFPPEIMQLYAPDYVSAKRYQELLQENAARRALHEAAALGTIEISAYPRLEFEKRSEAELAGQLSEAQQVVARLEPAVDQVYQILERGEADREKLQSKRWQAGYDLAMGRAAAMKVRLEGYNAMLAALKRGRTFQNAASTRWILQPADTVELSSVLRRMGDKATFYLKRVSTDNPQTPWSVLARHELATPIGWQWTER